MPSTTIYGLVDPQTQELRYVGKTIQKPEYRLASHVTKTRNKRTHSEAWIKGLVKKGLRPELLIIDEVEHNWQFWEQFYINYFRSIGCRLTNHTEGGDTSNTGRKWTVRDASRMGGKGKSVILDELQEFSKVKECAEFLGGTARSLVKSLKLGRTYKGHSVKYKVI